MSKAVEEQYRDLLNPIKDPEKSFQIDIALLLQNYITSFIQGRVPPNFNSAALLLQGSSSIYSKKVEYLHNLATQLYQNLTKQKKDEQAKKDTIKVKDKQKENKFNDPFFSTEIKLGKNLSCLKRKTAAKSIANKKGGKNAGKSGFSIPVDLLPYEGEEKGHDFFDTNNDVVGKKGDFTLNKCRVTVSGWLMLPTVSSDQIPTENSPPDYTFVGDISNHCSDDGDCDMPEPTPDEGFDMDTPSLSQPMSTQSLSQPSSSPDIPMSQQTDEGVGSMTSTPSEQLSQPCSQPTCSTELTPDSNIENIPMDGVIEGLDKINKSAQRSERQALKMRQIDEDNLDSHGEDNDEDFPGDNEEEVIVVKRAIQKNNTLSLPAKLLPGNKKKTRLEHCSEFCSRTYFLLDVPTVKNGFNFSLSVPSFKSNTKLTAKVKQRLITWQAGIRKIRKIDEEAERKSVDVENLSDSDKGEKESMLHSLLQDDDIVIQNEPAPMEVVLENQENPIPEIEDAPEGDLSLAELPPPDYDDNVPNFEDIVREQVEIFTKDVAQHLQDTDITKKVHEWETKLNPFLKELEQREPFDINEYGRRILESFNCSKDGAKQMKLTKTFRHFCKGMEKWQIHRYFMALLPLANIGNVELKKETRPDGEEDILITLLSTQMHHLHIEEFSGNGD